MSKVPAASFSVPGSLGLGGSPSASAAKICATSIVATPAAPKLLSCVICRSRKVRCDKLSPCSNCRRADIPCIFPSADRPPRWARRLERSSNHASSAAKAPQEAGSAVGQVIERLRNLESLVKDLSDQLELAKAGALSAGTGPSSVGSSTHACDVDHPVDISSTAHTTRVQKQLGSLTLQDVSQNLYAGNGFWSRVNDQIDALKNHTCGLAADESDVSGDEDSPEKTPSTQELERTPSERHAFLFQHYVGHSDRELREFHPMPSQIPFLLNVYAESVNPFLQALMFSIYYAAVISMEETDITTDFGCSKADLSLKFRLGLEYALAKADFLNEPDIVLVQAFTIFLFLVRRHDHPRFVWMMTGLVIRMAQALGLQRDGSHFENLTPYEVEIRRRVWWAVCMLDLRTSEDQGMELTIAPGSFDTRLPLNINDADIDPQKNEIPPERQSMTDMTFTVASIEMCDVMRRLMATAVGDITPDSEAQDRLLNEIFEKSDRSYFQHSTESENVAYWVAVNSSRLIKAKMTLIMHLPLLFSPPSEHVSDEIRTKLLISAIEVAEYNHSLNSEEACRKWRWMFQTYTHWHAIVYLLMATSQRPWSSIIERAWVALHSRWLIPLQSKPYKNLRILFPLRKLMAKARKHRDVELDRLRGNARAAAQLEMEDSQIPLPGSSGPFRTGKSEEIFREHWRKLIAAPEESEHGKQERVTPASRTAAPSVDVDAVNTAQQGLGSVSLYGEGDLWSNSSYEAAFLAGQDLSDRNTALSSSIEQSFHTEETLEQTDDSSYIAPHVVPLDWSSGTSIGLSTMPWLWADANQSFDLFADLEVNMDLDADINWYSWVESANGMDF